MVGFGDPKALISVYIANRPQLAPYRSMALLVPLEQGEIAHIVSECGNHWRKIFNCYAKLLYSVDPLDYLTWQSYRDELLLQQGSRQQLRFDQDISGSGIKIITGHTYAASLHLPYTLERIDADFSVAWPERLLVCPYFDYRQLSNAKLDRLRELILALL